MTTFQLLTIGASAIALIAAGSLLLPGQVRVERQAIIDATSEQVMELASSSEGYQQFNPFRTADPDLKIAPFGPAAGIGSGFHFDGEGGKGSQTVAAITANSVRYQIDMGPMGRPVQTITTSPTREGLLVSWSMDADLGINPVQRIFGLFMDRMIGDTLQQGLANLDTAT
ncbi:MAG: SRPBCC family protein [Alphaproteobacteria bacterium]|nr:SRPBCC family protein [Alphaproteobacteria bacterium]